MKSPLSGFNGEMNGATWAIAQRQQDLDNAIKDFQDAVNRGYDITDFYIQDEIFEHNNLLDISPTELRYIEDSVNGIL
jgi:hypothetical protein